MMNNQKNNNTNNSANRPPMRNANSNPNMYNRQYTQGYGGQYMQNPQAPTNNGGANRPVQRQIPQRNMTPGQMYDRQIRSHTANNTGMQQNYQYTNRSGVNRQPAAPITPQPKKQKKKLELPKIKLPKSRKKLRSPGHRYNDSVKAVGFFNLSPRHSSLSALIALIVAFAGIITAVGIGAHKNFERVVLDVAPSFEIEFTKLLNDSQCEPIDRVDMSVFSKPLDAEIYSKAALLTDLSTGVKLAYKEADTRIYPASLTKIMTTLLAIENLTDLEEKYQFTDEIFITLRGMNASVAGFEAWEVVTVRDLIYGVMLPSGAEASVAVAELIAGSETAFADVMNKKADELGLENTHFVNCTGLHDDDHYTTVSDLAKLLDYALKNEFFREVFTTKTYTTTKSKYHQAGMTFESTVFKYIRAQGETRNNKYIIGGKTGYTIEGGQCLATLATDGEFEYILITTGAGDGTNRPYYNVLDAIYIYDRYLKNEVY